MLHEDLEQLTLLTQRIIISVQQNVSLQDSEHFINRMNEFAEEVAFFKSYIKMREKEITNV